MKKVVALLVPGMAALSVAANASMVTEIFQVTLPLGASGSYPEGHVFDITVTYDDAGTVMHDWEDGANGIAEFGGGDDLLSNTYSLADAAFSGYTVLSDADISISGRQVLPAGATPLDAMNFNLSTFAIHDDGTDPPIWELSLWDDDLRLSMWAVVGGSYGLFNLRETFTFDSGEPGSYNSRSGKLASDIVGVPEPTTPALLGLGLAGVGLARRRMNASRLT